MESFSKDGPTNSGSPKTIGDSNGGLPTSTNGTPPSSTTPGPRGTKRVREDDDEANADSIPTNPPFTAPPTPAAVSSSSPATAPPPPPAFTAAAHAHDGKTHLLLASTGSVATIKLPLILHSLSRHAPHLSIRVILSRASTRFLAGQSAEQPHWPSLRDIPNVDGVYTDEDEWARPWTRGAPILHIELRRWADVLLIAPLSANALGKMVAGLCDDLVSEVLRAWDVDGRIDGAPRFGKAEAEENGTGVVDAKKKSPFGGDLMSSKYATTTSFTPSPPPVARPSRPVHRRRKVVLVAPAMNTAMWKHPVTKSQMRVLEWDWNVNRDGWVEVLRPQEKALACGDTGDGAMMEWSKIVGVIEDRMGLGKGKEGEDGAERNAKRVKT